jgi:hypothetical protein
MEKFEKFEKRIKEILESTFYRNKKNTKPFPVASQGRSCESNLEIKILVELFQ